jgi:hypothetical protein
MELTKLNESVQVGVASSMQIEMSKLKHHWKEKKKEFCCFVCKWREGHTQRPLRLDTLGHSKR